MNMKTQMSLLLVVLFAAFISACNNNTASNEAAEQLTTESPDNAHNSKNALDWFGTYSGVVPCADCEGIETTIVLNQDETFTKKTKYLGKSEEVFEGNGNIQWSDDGNTILLNNIDGFKTSYKVGENYLLMLDTEGNIITGNLANKYILKKAVAISTLSETTIIETVENINLVGTNWKLVELMGKPVARKESYKEDPFMLFTDEGRIAAYAGCNSMAGSYEIKEGNQISFSKIIATMMACEEMSTEKTFAEVLGKTDNYAINGKILSLNKARMAPLAKFEATD